MLFMNTGNAWTNRNEDGTVSGISISVDEAALCLIPQLKGLKLMLKFIPKEQRKTEKSPDWNFIMYKPQKQTQSQEPVSDEEIPF